MFYDVVASDDAATKAELFQVFSDYAESQRAFLDGLDAWRTAKRDNSDPILAATTALSYRLNNHADVVKLWMRLSPYREYASSSLSGWIANKKKVPADAADRVPGLFFQLWHDKPDPDKDLGVLADSISETLETDDPARMSNNTRRITAPWQQKILGETTQENELEHWMMLQNLLKLNEPIPGLFARVDFPWVWRGQGLPQSDEERGPT